MQRQHTCSQYMSMAMLLQYCHMSLLSVVELIDVLSRQADIWLAWLAAIIVCVTYWL